MDPAGPRPDNKLLMSLRPEAYARVAPKLREVRLTARQILYKPNESIAEVYFPINSVICLMAVMNDGDTLETGTVGREGASWISATSGAPSMPCETIVAIAGDAVVLKVQDLDREMEQNEHFRDTLTRYSHALLIHSMRMTGCTGLHSLQQRCARWMLTTLDRVSEDRFAVTHEFLAMLLGSRRPSISVVLEDFQKRGVIRVERGRVLVADRKKLATVSCECYEVIRQHYAQVGKESGSG
ncbi:MAG: Crp/Fnr family transcriptional regulator [Vicinamibacterales bacterium]